MKYTIVGRRGRGDWSVDTTSPVGAAKTLYVGHDTHMHGKVYHDPDMTPAYIATLNSAQKAAVALIDGTDRIGIQIDKPGTHQCAGYDGVYYVTDVTIDESGFRAAITGRAGDLGY